MERRVKAIVLHVLAQFPQVQIAYLFGSAARAQFTSSSDIDVAAAADIKLPLDTRLAIAT
jgi:predicted nucleotidyltransferase